MSYEKEKEWYDNLNKPKFQPPPWVFAPVWTVLYVLMIVAFVLVLKAPFTFTSIFAYFFFTLQLAVNLSWSPVFFKEHNLRKAFMLCVVLTFLVFLTMLTFFNISKLAGILFFPYLLWCIFATVLSFEILERNEW